MEFELLEQSVMYRFNNEAYGDKGYKDRTLKNVRKDASAEAVVSIGKAMAGLQDDVLSATTLIQKHGVPITD